MKLKKISTGQGDDYTTGCLLDFAYFEKNYRLTAADLTKQKALYADSRAIQQIIFTGKIKATVASTRVVIFYILKKSKETILEFTKGTTKFCKSIKKTRLIIFILIVILILILIFIPILIMIMIIIIIIIINIIMIMIIIIIIIIIITINSTYKWLNILK